MRRSVPLPVALAVLLALIAPTPAEGGPFRHRRARPPPCPPPSPPTCLSPAPAAAPYAMAGMLGKIMVCMVCEDNVWRPANADELGTPKCQFKDVKCMGLRCDDP